MSRRKGYTLVASVFGSFGVVDVFKCILDYSPKIGTKNSRLVCRANRFIEFRIVEYNLLAYVVTHFTIPYTWFVSSSRHLFQYY